MTSTSARNGGPATFCRKTNPVHRKLTGVPKRRLSAEGRGNLLRHNLSRSERISRHATEVVSALYADNRKKRAWRLDIAALVGHERFMGPTRALGRLGHHIMSRRVALGYRTRTDLANSLKVTVRTLADIEHGVRKAQPRHLRHAGEQAFLGTRQYRHHPGGRGAPRAGGQAAPGHP
jgi:hypothetical protein